MISIIPKVINYCWFGGKPLPEEAQKCITSWGKFLPDYEIKQWNESNFNLDCCNYVKEASSQKKWAFVSDYARFWILYNYGGIYLDTDVEVIKPFDKIISKGPFMGCQENDLVNSGLGLSAPAGMQFYKKVLNYYENQHFVKSDGSLNQKTVVYIVTDMLKRDGFSGNGNIEKVDGIYIYPKDYFCPLDYLTKKLNITENTVTIHHFSATWVSGFDNLVFKIENDERIKSKKIRRMLSFPFRVLNKIDELGLSGVLKFIKDKYS